VTLVSAARLQYAFPCSGCSSDGSTCGPQRGHELLQPEQGKAVEYLVVNALRSAEPTPAHIHTKTQPRPPTF
jgi:hypothetical protein